MSAAVAISVAVHAAGVVVAWCLEDDEERVKLTVIEVEREPEDDGVPLTSIDDLTIAPVVALPRDFAWKVPEIDPIPDPPRRSAAAGTTTAAPARIATTGRTGGAETAKGTGASGGTATAAPSSGEGKRMMTMRHPDLRKPISGAFLDRFLENSKPVPRADDTPERVDDDLAAARSAARRGVPGARETVVALNEQKAAQELKAAGGGTYKADKGTFRAKVREDGTVELKDAPNLQRQGLGAKFDVTDALMRANGDDPYAAEKRKFLDRTREQRVNIGTRYKKEQLSRSAEFAQKNIDRLWATVTDVKGRKQGMFDLWDDCEDVATGGSTGGDRVAGGAAARALIEATIRARLTGPNAYTPAEIAALNSKRRSRALFVPYPRSPVRIEVERQPE
ncbi:MAG: hypothetical protein KIT31_25705 [Deltaproteobacteria bacterium]|nr:hypothetical protein [Deltaproteobacteria bacterium]